MLDKIAMVLRCDCSLQVDDRLVVGVSGGPDSLCLLYVLHKLAYHPIVLHVNHKLRPEADQEAQTVQDVADRLGLQFISYTVDVYAHAEEQSLSVEEAARVLRYRVLFEYAENINARAVLVAHNADDQVETILMHLLRGSGLVGLRGMEHYQLPNPWCQHIPLVRPLISTFRQEILAYLAEHEIRYISDQSNFDTTYFRNRLRFELLPELEKYNPRIRENLLRMAKINKEDYAVIQSWVDTAWQTNLVNKGPGYVVFQLAGFQALPASIQRYMLRKAIAYHLPSLRDIDFESITRGIAFLCDGQKHGQVDLIAGLRLLKERDLFWLATWSADLPGSDFPAVQAGQIISLNIPSSIRLNDGWQLDALPAVEPGQENPQYPANQDSFHAWLDLDELEIPLSVRCRRPGERYTPQGMDGHSLKISDLMINIKIPRRARPTWPLVCSGQTVVWVPGYRQAQLGRARSASRHVAHLILSRSSGA